MKTILYILLIFGLLFAFWSCGLKIPEKLPDSVSLEFTKHVEFPITTIDYSMQGLTEPFISQFEEEGFYKVSDAPLTLSYSTSVEFSPKDLFTELENNVKDTLTNFASNISFSFSVDEVFDLTLDNQTITLPSISGVSGTFAVSSILLSDVQLISTTIPVFNGSTSTSIPISTDQFNSIHLVQGVLNVSKASTDIDLNQLELGFIVNDTEYKDGDILTDLLLENNQNITLVATYNGTGAGEVDISVKLSNLEVDKGTGLEISNFVISPTIDPISIDNQNWQLTLAGNLQISFTVNATNLELTSEVVVKSGDQIIASGSPVTFDASKIINANDDLNIEATLTLAGSNVDIDLTSPITYNVIPNVSIENIYNYPVNFEQVIELPNNIVETTIGTGAVILDFTGVSIIEATGSVYDATITNTLISNATSLILDFSDISLPSTILLSTISGKIEGQEISFSGHLSDDFEIAKAKISNELLSSANQNFSYDIPQEIKDFVNSLDATILINLTYNATDISGLTLKIQSNFFEEKDIVIDNSGEATISNQIQHIDFNTLNNISLTIEATGTPEITNIKKGQTYGIDISTSLPIFELDNFDVKSQSFEVLPPTTIFDFSTMEGTEILSNLDFDIYMPVEFKSTNTTVNSTLTFLVSGTTIKIGNNDPEIDLGSHIYDIIKTSSPLTISASLTTSSGILSKDSVFGLSGSLTLPLEGTPTSDIKLYETSLELSDIDPLIDIVDSATLTFANWENTTGISINLSLNTLDFVIGDSTPVISLSNEDLNNLIPQSTLSIFLPKDEFIQFNNNGYIKIAPYILLDLKIATSISFGGGE